MRAYKRPSKVLPRSIGHIEEWVRAIRGGEQADANFSFSGKVTETLILGNVALNSGEKIFWDRENFETHSNDANQFLHRTYRDGWEI